MNIKLCKFKGPVGFQTEGPLILDLGMKESRNAQAQECEWICLNRVGCCERWGGALSQEAVDALESRTYRCIPAARARLSPSRQRYPWEPPSPGEAT